jgi:hypothetical protein
MPLGGLGRLDRDASIVGSNEPVKHCFAASNVETSANRLFMLTQS